MKKKLLSLLLALCLVMALVPMTAFAEENEQSSKTSITTVDELWNLQKLWTMANMTIKQMRLYLLMQIWINRCCVDTNWQRICCWWNSAALLQRQILRKRAYDFQFGFFRKLRKDRVSVFRVFQWGLRCWNFRFDNSRQAECVQFRVCLFWNGSGRCSRRQNFWLCFKCVVHG